MKRDIGCWIPLKSFSERKNGGPSSIVIHYVSAKWSNPDRPYDMEEVITLLRAQKLSYHYIIGRGGNVVQCVDENDRAWHAGFGILFGKGDLNDTSIGVSFVATHDSGFNDSQISSGVKLCREIVKDYEIPLNHVVGHSHVDWKRKVDPGQNFPWIRFLNDIANG